MISRVETFFYKSQINRLIFLRLCSKCVSCIVNDKAIIVFVTVVILKEIFQINGTK